MDDTNLLLTEIITKVHSDKLYRGLSEPTFVTAFACRGASHWYLMPSVIRIMKSREAGSTGLVELIGTVRNAFITLLREHEVQLSGHRLS